MRKKDRLHEYVPNVSTYKFRTVAIATECRTSSSEDAASNRNDK